MTWQFLAEIELQDTWTATPLTGGQLFRIKSTSTTSSPDYLWAAIAQVIQEGNDFTFFEARRIGFKQEVEAFLFLLPESLPGRKLAVKRLDDSPDVWTLEIEELVGGLNLPIYPTDITGLPEALAGKVDVSKLWYPERFSHWHQDSTVVTGGALVSTIASNQQFSTRSYQSPPALGDSFKFRACLASGSYNLRILGSSDVNNGILSLQFNGQTLPDLDWYSNRPTSNVVKSFALNIASSGFQEFSFLVSGKNSASTGYFIMLTKLDLFKI